MVGFCSLLSCVKISTAEQDTQSNSEREFIMDAKELKVVLDKHAAWIKNEGGERADLSGADLRGADLRGADLV
jgi:uncharacterized protein YjbI with pentapeptide repeats